VEIIKETTIDNIANAKYILEGKQKEEMLNFIFNKCIYLTNILPIYLLKNTEERSEVVFLLFSYKRP
jgi:hypothetical protein